MIHKEALEPYCLCYIIPAKYPFMNGACNSLRIARIQLREVKLLRAAASTSTNFTHLYNFKMHYNKQIRATDLSYRLLYINRDSEVLNRTQFHKGIIYTFLKVNIPSLQYNILLFKILLFWPTTTTKIYMDSNA